MNADLLKNTGMGVPYKYVIFSNRLAELNDPYEVVYEVPSTNDPNVINRCLCVPGEKCHPKGEHN